MKDLNPANVLIAIRDHIANDLESLSVEFAAQAAHGSPPYSPSASPYGQYGSYLVRNVLRQLLDAGLIVCEGSTDDLSGRIEVIPNWRKVQAVLGLSLKQLGEKSSDTVMARPYFGKPHELSGPLDIFVLMSFQPEFRAAYDVHIVNVASALNLVAKRADDFFGAHHIMTDVWEAINAARILIADCTGRNPNVFYEIGVAHTLGRTVILITQSKDDVPFDLQSIRYILYENTSRGLPLFEQSLKQTLRKELGL